MTMGVDVPFKSTMNFTYGEPEGMAPRVSRVVANNPSAFTFKGTNTYLVGSLSLAVIDPGPNDEEHTKAILKAAAGRPITHILITHAHRDHVDGLKRLVDATGAESIGYGRNHLTAHPELKGPTGSAFVDARFKPTTMVEHGDMIKGEDWTLEAIHTPGHAPDHLCFSLAGTGILFSGDHVMAWNTTVIAPPEGSMADYIASLQILLQRPASVYLPGHGGRIEDPTRFVKAYLLHRRWRERAIHDAIAEGTKTIPQLVARVYRNVGRELLGAATASVKAHVEHLISQGQVQCDGPLSATSQLQVTQQLQSPL